MRLFRRVSPVILSLFAATLCREAAAQEPVAPGAPGSPTPPTTSTTPTLPEPVAPVAPAAPAPAAGAPALPASPTLPTTPTRPADSPQPFAPQPGAPPSPAAATTASGGPELTSLRILREKGVISPAEYDAALRDLRETQGNRAGEGHTTFVIGKWATTLYGFLEADNIWDSTQSLTESAGHALIPREDTYAGKHSRFQMGVRNSRIGFRMKAPEFHGIRASAIAEMDFLGYQPSPFSTVGSSGAVAPNSSEGSFYGNPTFRIRHFNVKVETPVVDVLIGQSWQLLGWQSLYQPNTVEIQGVPGEVYSRTPQIRLSKTIDTGPVTIELAAAATRPVQRDSGSPDGQAGIRVAVDEWTGMQTVGATGTSINPLSVALTGYGRRVRLPQYAAKPDASEANTKKLGGFAIDAFVPVLPATKDKKGNALSLLGEFSSGRGNADFYTGLGGVGTQAGPPLPNPMNASPAPSYLASVDPGIVVYDNANRLESIHWRSFLIGAQYYLPSLDGKVWLSANYSNIKSDNAGLYIGNDAKNQAKILEKEEWWDVNLFADPTPALRLGLEYANFKDTYADTGTATSSNVAVNHRVQLSGWFLF